MSEELSFIEFMVKPSLMTNYIKSKEKQIQRAIFLNYLDHILSLVNEDTRNIKEAYEGRKKVQKLFQILIIINETYTPTFPDFQNYPIEFIRFYFDRIQAVSDSEYYRLLKYAVNVAHAKNLVLQKEQSDERINKLICFDELMLQLQNITEFGLALLVLQLLIELRLLQEQYQIEPLFDLYDKIPHYDTHPGFSAAKVEDYRKIVSQFQTELSPVTEAEDEKIEPILEENDKESGWIYFHQSLMPELMAPRLMSIYLSNAISTNNRDLLLSVQKAVAAKNKDSIVDQLIQVYFTNPDNVNFQQIEALIRSLEFSKLYDIHLVTVFASVIFFKGEQIRINRMRQQSNLSEQHLPWKEMRRCILALIGRLKSSVPETSKGTQEFVESILKNQITLAQKIDSFVVNVQLALYLILCGMIYLVYNSNQPPANEFKILLDSLNLIFDKLQSEQHWDIFKLFIENCLSKTILELVQCLLIKQILEIKATEFTPYYAQMGFLIQEFGEYELKMPGNLKFEFIRLAFKREKLLMIQTFDSLQLYNKLLFKYSKLYKKKSMYYHHVKNYQKSLRYIIKYFQAYLYSPNFATQCYLEEVQILQCFNLNFKELNAHTHYLISAQFIQTRIEQQDIEDLSMPSELVQFFFEGRIIEAICERNSKNQELMRLMIPRMQDQDSYMHQSSQLKQQTREKYLNLFLNYLNEQLLK